MFAFAWKGILIGILVSAPMGPVGMLCIQRTLSKGRWHGFVTGLGAAMSDMLYAATICLGMGIVVGFIEANQAPLQLIGSIVLGLFGYYTFQTNPVKRLQTRKENKISYTQDFISAFLLTFSNILIILLFVGLFARFGFVQPSYPIWMTLSGVGFIAFGAILWWFGITWIVSKLKQWFNIRSIWLLNRITGTLLMLVALVGVASVVLPSSIRLPLITIYN